MRRIRRGAWDWDRDKRSVMDRVFDIICLRGVSDGLRLQVADRTVSSVAWLRMTRQYLGPEAIAVVPAASTR